MGLRGLFKDSARAGTQAGPAEALVERTVSSPSLAVAMARSQRKTGHAREADAIFRQEMRRSRQKADQYFAVLTDTRTVGVMGDFRTHGWTVALRAVKTTDFMTCQVVPVSHSLLARTAARIVNEVKGVGRVVYDITGKPPATIEWE